MILITKNAQNNVVCTLNENIVGGDDYTFLFELTNDTSGETKLFTAQDESSASLRYNMFTITESASEDLYNGTVELSPIGYWSYSVYQMPVASPPDLDPTNSVSVLEHGKVLVIEAPTAEQVFDENDDIDNIVFDA